MFLTSLIQADVSHVPRSLPSQGPLQVAFVHLHILRVHSSPLATHLGLKSVYALDMTCDWTQTPFLLSLAITNLIARFGRI